MCPVGSTAVVQPALLSYSGPGRVTQRNSCVSESQSPSFALLTSAAMLVHVGKKSSVCCPISRHWCGVLGTGFWAKGEMTLLVYPVLIARCQGSCFHPRLTGRGAGSGITAAQAAAVPGSLSWLSQLLFTWTRDGPRSPFTGVQAEGRRSALHTDTTDPRRHEEGGEG